MRLSASIQLTCAAFLITTIVACRDSVEPKKTGSLDRVLSGQMFSAVELDSINPMRRIGRLHSLGTRVFRRALRERQTFAKACEAAAVWVLTDAELSDLLSTAERAEVAKVFRENSRCISERVRRVSRAAVSTEYPYTITSAGLAVIDAMTASVGSIPDQYARNEDTLAARLSPHYTSSLSLPSGDAEAVQTLISIAQSSLSDVNSDFDATQSAEEAFIESCAQGQAENEHYYAPDAEYVCLNQEWRVVVAAPRSTNYRLYSVLWTGSAATLPNCFQTIKNRGIDIVLSDVGGGIVGALFFGPVGAFGGATVASGEMFYFHIYEVVYCYLLGTPVPLE